MLESARIHTRIVLIFVPNATHVSQHLQAEAKLVALRTSGSVPVAEGGSDGSGDGSGDKVTVVAATAASPTATPSPTSTTPPPATTTTPSPRPAAPTPQPTSSELYFLFLCKIQMPDASNLRSTEELCVANKVTG